MPDEARSWLALVLGVAIATAVGVLLGLGSSALVVIGGIALGYAIWRALPPVRRPPRYWRGRAYRD